MSKYYIKKATNGQFYFTLTGGNGETILTSEMYVTKQGCERGIDSVRANSPYDSNYRRKESVSNQSYFNLVAGNNEIIGTSEMYSSSQAREVGISSVKTNGPRATVVDLT